MIIRLTKSGNYFRFFQKPDWRKSDNGERCVPIVGNINFKKYLKNRGIDLNNAYPLLSETEVEAVKNYPE